MNIKGGENVMCGVNELTRLDDENEELREAIVGLTKRIENLETGAL